MHAADLLLTPLRLALLQRSFAEAIVIGMLCGVIGTYVVLRGMAFLGDAMAHAVFPGVVIAYLLRVDLVFGGLAFGLLTALGIGTLSRHRRISMDSAIGVLFVGAFALGVVLISSIRSYVRDLAGILLGDILGVTSQDVWLTVAVGCLVVAAVYLFHKELSLVSFDMEMAEAMGLPVALLDIGLLVLLALIVIVSIQAVGTVLVLAMLVTPATTARLLTERLAPMMAVAAALGALAGVIGLYASYYLNVASGGAVVLVATGFFFLAWLCAPRHGVLRRRAGLRPVAAAVAASIIALAVAVPARADQAQAVVQLPQRPDQLAFNARVRSGVILVVAPSPTGSRTATPFCTDMVSLRLIWRQNEDGSGCLALWTGSRVRILEKTRAYAVDDPTLPIEPYTNDAHLLASVLILSAKDRAGKDAPALAGKTGYVVLDDLDWLGARP
jgi:manganese/iron transport system permease protein